MRITRAAIVAAVLFTVALIAPRDAYAAPFSVTSTDNGQALLAALFGANPIGLSDFTIQHAGPRAASGTFTDDPFGPGRGLVLSTVPEPASLVLLGTGLVSLIGMVRPRLSSR